jgi:hypothetical protein
VFLNEAYEYPDLFFDYIRTLGDVKSMFMLHSSKILSLRYD